jgi:hypothetical protein
VHWAVASGPAVVCCSCHRMQVCLLPANAAGAAVLAPYVPSTQQACACARGSTLWLAACSKPLLACTSLHSASAHQCMQLSCSCCLGAWTRAMLAGSCRSATDPEAAGGGLHHLLRLSAVKLLPAAAGSSKILYC